MKNTSFKSQREYPTQKLQTNSQEKVRVFKSQRKKSKHITLVSDGKTQSVSNPNGKVQNSDIFGVKAYPGFKSQRENPTQ